MDSVRISLVVPTYNRARSLASALPALLAQSLPGALYEILVVDNNSTDATEATARDSLAHARCAWRYVHEPRQGLHHARNRGIVEAKGDIVVFGDDDIVADAGWLDSILREFDRDPRVGIVGGRVLPLWETPPPPWVFDYGTDKIHIVFAFLDRGTDRLELEHDYVFGCNMAVRRSVAIEVGGSLPDTFPKSLRALSGTGECGMADRARALGYKVVYAPNALVHHHVEASRATLGYFLERYRRLAIEDVYHEFRRGPRWPAALRLARRAVRRMTRVPRTAWQRSRPGHAAAIETVAVCETAAQIARVLTSRELYEHITRSTYL